MDAPDFWYPEQGEKLAKPPLLLRLAAAFYSLGGRIRQWQTQPVRVPAIVFCVGNVVAGGVGKTPVALALAARLQAKGRTVYFLSRGYGGRERGPLRVDPARHDASAVGDEPLLLAAQAPTIIARARAAGAWLACAEGADAIVMDDGFQNPSLAKDLSLVVIDSDTGFGNGRVIPAGPLREPLARGLARAQGVVLMGEGPPPEALERTPALPLLQARIVPEPATAQALQGARVIAFAGIGRPAKFFSMLGKLGCTLVRAEGFPDHHCYAESELSKLKQLSRAAHARLVTTAKDFARIPPSLREGIECVPVHAEFSDEDALNRLLDDALLAFARREAPGATREARDPDAHRTN